MHDETGPGLFFVPLEACEDGEFEFIIGLGSAIGKAVTHQRGFLCEEFAPRE